MTDSPAQQKMRLVVRNNRNKHLLIDIARVSNGLCDMDKATRALFHEFLTAAWKQVKFNDDQIALLGNTRDPEKVKVNTTNGNAAQARKRQLIIQANKPEPGSPCLSCGGTGYIDKKSRACSCPFGQAWLVAERKRLGIVI